MIEFSKNDLAVRRMFSEHGPMTIERAIVQAQIIGIGGGSAAVVVRAAMQRLTLAEELHEHNGLWFGNDASGGDDQCKEHGCARWRCDEARR